ncbi:uncharacterized protein LOC127378407 isoform X4 [Dicentrarchus labrax]|uniref:uncharacterized protein LOC127378407 isoform X4 n=1 Tax=Dicentrarchus labrax TaxID=13489 RepID=UPI0021F5A0D5|nr:uncharacterized protein LOC127378407 isoform X4 [Dicentrarchus labrax]
MLYSTSSSYFLTNMAKLRLFFVLLLPLTVSSVTEVTLVKTIGSKPDVTPICTNETQQIITLVVCKIRTQMRGEECRLLFRYGQDFVHECDSRFRLMMENQTIFLYLTSLTPVDSGNFTCECTHPGDTYILHLNITVEDVVEDEDDRNSTLTLSVLIGVTTVTIITGVILGLIYRTKCNGGCSRSATSGLSVCEPPGSLDLADPDDLYTSLQQPESDLYQTISNPARILMTVPVDNQEINGGETDSSWDIYENISTKE